MDLSDIPFWGGVVGHLLDHGMNKVGARTCATKGHKWHDIGAIMRKQDGSIEELPRGAMQRCRRCGEERTKPPTA